MSSQTEIEFKNLLTEEEFNSLRDAFSLSDTDFHSQTNTYFDTDDFQLKEAKKGFRLRVVGDRNELTLKSPGDNPHTMLEITELISNEKRDQILSQGYIDTHLYQAFSQLPNQVNAFGSLRTERAEIPYEGGLLVFDHSYYMQLEDFEVEYEVEDLEAGRTHFYDLLKKHNIPTRQTDK
ncbi:MAG: CYTH domain-containing protein, partial [Planococcaceae bacterium]|nr:CYTH domain-containing protein [Planococcaceae bacterium]